MTIGETVPAHKRREQQRAREETQRYLDAGGKITEYPIGYSKDSERAHEKTGDLTTRQRKALEAVRQHERTSSNGWVTGSTAAYQAGISSNDFSKVAARLAEKGLLEIESVYRGDAWSGRYINVYATR